MTEIKKFFALLVKTDFPRYLLTKDFESTCLYYDLDRLWDTYLTRIRRSSHVAVLVSGYTGDVEAALLPFLRDLHKRDRKLFEVFVSQVLNEAQNKFKFFSPADVKAIENQLVRLGCEGIRIAPVPSKIEIGGVKAALMERCFKTGVKGCPKKIMLDPRKVFIGMPLRDELKDIYDYGIRAALEELNLEPWKADEQISNIDIMCKICQGMQESVYALMEISDWNPNVIFELGLAYGLGKIVILLKRRGTDVPVDLKGLEYLEYSRAQDLKRLLKEFFRRFKAKNVKKEE